MSKRVFQASVRVSEYPRARFFIRVGTDAAERDKALPVNGAAAFVDVTHQVVTLIIEDLEQESGCCDIVRLDAQGKLVWRTRHPSIQEAKWHVEFEYGLPEEKWTPVA